MSTGMILAIIGALLLLAFLANRLFRLTRVPDVVVLMAAGVIVGPVLHWVNAAQFQRFTHVLGTLAIVLVLFEGGLELDIRPALRHFGGGALLALLSFLLTASGVALATMKLMGVGATLAMLVGAVLGCTSSTIVLPVLQQMESRQPLKITLIMESTLGDVLAVLSVGILLHLSTQQDSVVRGVIHGLLSYMVMSLLLAFAGG